MTDLEKLLDEHINKKVGEKLKKIPKDYKLYDIVNTIQNEIDNKIYDIESFKKQGLTLNQLELEGGLRTLIEISDYFNEYVLHDTDLKIKWKIDEEKG